MRKFINWYSISVIVILVIAAIILILIFLSEGNDYYTFPIVGGACLIFLFFALIVLTFARIVSLPSKVKANKLDSNVQENGEEYRNLRSEVAFISVLIGTLVTILVVIPVYDTELGVAILASFITGPIFGIIGVAFEKKIRKIIRKYSTVAIILAITAAIIAVTAVIFFNVNPRTGDYDDVYPPLIAVIIIIALIVSAIKSGFGQNRKPPNPP